jgi:hypothetical protein
LTLGARAGAALEELILRGRIGELDEREEKTGTKDGRGRKREERGTERTPTQRASDDEKKWKTGGANESGGGDFSR